MSDKVCRICGKPIERRANDPRPGYVWYTINDPTTDAAYCGQGTAFHQPAAVVVETVIDL